MSTAGWLPRLDLPTKMPAAGIPPPCVLICVDDAGVRQLIGLMLAHTGCTATGTDVAAWLGGKPTPGPRPTVLLLDAWPLRHAEVASQARVRLAAEPAALVLLVDSPRPTQLATQLGAIASLPLLFSLDDLVTAVQQAHSARARELRA